MPGPIFVGNSDLSTVVYPDFGGVYEVFHPNYMERFLFCFLMVHIFGTYYQKAAVILLYSKFLIKF